MTMIRRWALVAAMAVAAAGAATAGPIHVVTRRCSDVRFRAVYGRSWVHINRVPADVVLNANYFWRGSPLGIVVRDGRIVNPGLSGKPPRTAFVVQRINGQQRVRIVEVRQRGKRLYTRSGPLKNVRTLVQAGPRLLSGGRITVARRREGFRSDVARRTQRVGLGITPGGRLLVVAQQNVTLWEFARTFARLGASDAMNLDGGHSATLAVNRKVRMGSGRVLAGLAIHTPR